MSFQALRLVSNLLAIGLYGRSSPRALAAAFKICGRRLERRWPYLPKAVGKDLNLEFGDLLEFQFARSRDFTALIVGAFDGVANDLAGEFVRANECKAVFVEPQPGPFQRLCEVMRGNPRVELVNAAIDRKAGLRNFYSVPGGIAGMPDWAERLGSFDREHVLKHESRAPGLSRHIVTTTVRTLSFNDVLDRHGLRKLDLVQIDAEGMDAALLEWFPFEQIKPALLHYEVAHMSLCEHSAITMRLRGMGYRIFPNESATDDMAVLF